MKQFKLIILIFIVCLNLRMSIQSIPPVIEMIQKDLNISGLQVSLLTGIPVVCMGIFAFSVSWFRRRFGLNGSITILLIMLGIFTFLRGALPYFTSMLVITLGIGFCIAIIGPLVSEYIKKEFPNRVGLLIGVYSLSMGIGAVIASSTVLPIAEYLNHWTIAIGIWGIIPILGAIIWKYNIKETESKPIINQTESIKMPINNIGAWFVVIFFMLQSGIFYGITTWLIHFLSTIHWNSQWSVIGLTTFTAVQMVFSFVIPALIDKYFTLFIWILLCDILLFLGAILLCFISLPSFILVGIVFVAISTGGLFPLALTLPIMLTKTSIQAGSWTSFVQGFGYMFAGIIPILMGLLIDTFNHKLIFPIEIIILSILLLLVSLIINKKGSGQGL